MNTRVLITGGAGFIGSCLVRTALFKDWEVAIVYQPAKGLSALQDVADRIHAFPVRSDGSDISTPMGEFGPDVVFHLASIFLAAHQPEDIRPLLEANIAFGTQVLEAMARHHVPYLVNAGTSWQHAENKDYEPVNLYAATKQAFQDIVDYYVAGSALCAITLQLYDSYGPGDPRPKLFNLLDRAWREHLRLEMSPGEQLIDLVYVDDVARAFMIAAERLLERNAAGHEIYSVSSGTPIYLRDLVGTYQRVSGRSLNVVWGGRSYRPREVMVPWNRGERLPGWEPKVSLEEGIRLCTAASASDESALDEARG